jgi:hypothetical protein
LNGRSGELEAEREIQIEASVEMEDGIGERYSECERNWKREAA